MWRGSAETRIRWRGEPPAPRERPGGLVESDMVILRHEGTPRADEVPPHWEIAEAQGWWEPEKAARMSGSGFAILRGDGARLLRAWVVP